MLETDLECPKGERGDTGPEGGEEGPGPSWDVNVKEGTSLVGYKMKAARLIVNIYIHAQLDGLCLGITGNTESHTFGIRVIIFLTNPMGGTISLISVALKVTKAMPSM